jgi:hypothetical protein
MRARGVGLALGLAFAAAAAGLAGCRGSAKAGAPAEGAPGAGPASLESLPERFRAARAAEDHVALVALGHALVPTRAELSSLLRPGPAAERFLAVYPFHDLAPDHPAIGGLGLDLFAPGDLARTETHVHAATTEELAAYAEGTAAFSEFPHGMARFARLLAAPGVTWYAVEHVKPGEAAGMTFTAFAHVGHRLVYVPKPWRVLPKEGAGR